MKDGISGFTLARDCMANDYCIKECVESLLPICDEVVISDGESTDGSRELLERWVEREPKIRIVDYKWKYPKGDSKWFTDWINDARSHLRYKTMVQLDCDEILHSSPECHAAIKAASDAGKALQVDRLNLWRKDGKPMLIPDGHCVGKWVTRVGPSELWLPSDEPHLPGEVPILDMAEKAHAVRIWHVGFMRRRDAFYRKSKIVIEGFFHRWDTRLERGQKEGKELWETEAGADYEHLLEPINCEMPDPVQRWLSARGHATPNYIARLLTAPDPVIEIEPW